MPKNNPWEHLESQPSHIAATYGRVQDQGKFFGKQIYLAVEDIVYIREWRDNDGCRIMVRDSASGRHDWHTVLESVDDILQQVNQRATTYAEAERTGTLPDAPLPPHAFVTGTFSKHDENHTGGRIAFRMKTPAIIRQANNDDNDSFVRFNKGDGSLYFLLEESPEQLFRIAGRKLPVSPRQKRKAEKSAAPKPS
ncbi:MAG: hypothetical protein Alpg2KO_09660 [Alphaproteobacteria bacterium]